MLPSSSSPSSSGSASSSSSAIAVGLKSLCQVKSEPEPIVVIADTNVIDSQKKVADSEQKSSPPPPPLIDTSTPESLERDFHAWLKGELKTTRRALSCSGAEPTVRMYFATDAFLKAEQMSPMSANGLLMDCTTIMQIGERRISLPPVHFKEECFSLLSAGQSPSSSSNSSAESSPDQHGPRHSSDGEIGQHGEEGIILTEIGAMKGAMGAAADGNNRTQTDSPGSRSSGVNQLGRTYSPGLPLSMSERQQIVELHKSGWKICDISKCLCITHSCVSKILQRYRTTGSVRPKDAKEGRQESPLVAAIRDYRLRLGIVRQSEIREQLIRDGLCHRENAPSRSSINHILRTKLNMADPQQGAKNLKAEAIPIPNEQDQK